MINVTTDGDTCQAEVIVNTSSIQRMSKNFERWLKIRILNNQTKQPTRNAEYELFEKEELLKFAEIIEKIITIMLSDDFFVKNEQQIF